MDERQIASAVDRWARAHRQELIADLKDLVAIRSVGAPPVENYPFGIGCAQAADHFIDIGRKYGMTGENDDYYTVSLLLKGRQKQEIAILGHLDVVDAGKNWKRDAFQPWDEKGFVFGRGSLDNKGPLLTAVYALRCIRELGLLHQCTFRVIAGCDEEKEMRDVAFYLSRREAPLFTLICDGAWPVCIGEKGLLKAELSFDIPQCNLLALEGGNATNQVPDWASVVLRDCSEESLKILLQKDPYVQIDQIGSCVKVSVKGKTAHCSTPENGINAILLLVDVLCRNTLLHEDVVQKLSTLKKAFTDIDGTGLKIYYADQMSGRTTCIPSKILLKDQKICVGIDIRYPVTRDGGLLISQLEKQCERMGVRLKIISHHSPFVFPENDPVCKMLLKTCERHLSRRVKPYTTGGVSYARFFPRSVPFGPAYRLPKALSGCGEPHAANEGVSIDQLLEAVKVYVIALLKLDSHFQNEPFLM